MSDQSLGKYKQEAKEKTAKTDASVKVLDTTQRDGVATADKAGAVKSELSDINAEIRRLRGGILKSIERAVGADAGVVKERVEDTKRHRGKVESVRERTTKERQKADSVKPKDSRMTGGAEMSRLLEKTGRELSDISTKESETATSAERKRHDLEARLRSAIDRNR